MCGTWDSWDWLSWWKYGMQWRDAAAAAAAAVRPLAAFSDSALTLLLEKACTYGAQSIAMVDFLYWLIHILRCCTISCYSNCGDRPQRRIVHLLLSHHPSNSWFTELTTVCPSPCHLACPSIQPFLHTAGSCIHGYFVASFTYFNETTAMWAGASLFCRFTARKVYGTGSLKHRKHPWIYGYYLQCRFACISWVRAAPRVKERLHLISS